MINQGVASLAGSVRLAMAMADESDVLGALAANEVRISIEIEQENTPICLAISA